jgi:hypothetical protein
MQQIKIERTSTDPVQARVTMRTHIDGAEQTQEITDVAQATAMTDALENAPGGSLLGVWRGPGM